MAPRLAAFLPLALGALVVPGAAEEIGDRARGEVIFGQCAACHDVGEGAGNRIGPSLNRIFGRRAGTEAGFDYSENMRRMGVDGLIWTLDTLDPYLENPRALVSRTRMAFAGLKTPQDRADVLAYLRDFSDQPSDIPEAEPTARLTEYGTRADVLAIAGDPEYGEYLSAECVACHQVSGAAGGIPSITRWPEEDFVAAMNAYKNGLRAHSGMRMIAGRLGDEEIAALAAYFATIAP